MLKIDLKAAEKEFLWTSCVDDVIATVANYYQMDYRFAYANAWGFHYVPWKEKPDLPFGKRIDTTNAVERYDFLEVCHGIRMVYHRNRTIEELLSIVKTELEAKRPCALHIDSYELTWDAGYQRWHTNHVIMPQEITEDSIKLIDPYNYRINLEFPIQQLCANTTKFCITFEVKPEQSKQFPLLEEYEKVLERLLDHREKLDAFQQMRQFVTDFREHFQPELEFAENNGFFGGSSFHMRLVDMAFGRSFARQALIYLAEVLDSKELMELLNHLRRMISRFNFAISIMSRTFQGTEEQKQVNGKGTKEVIERVADMFWAEAELEEQTARQLLEEIRRLLRIKSMRQVNAVAYETMTRKTDSLFQQERRKKLYESYSINLEPFYNNVGFATLDHSGIADFTGVGEFFLYNERVEEYQWKDQGVEYLMKPYEFNQEDNIACKGQIIEVPQVMAKKIGFLATAEWGSYYEEVTVVYQDQSTERYYIGLTDFANFPRYGENIVYQGPTGMKEKDGVSPWQTEARIFSVIKAIKPGKIIRIQLPNCERVHIFGITLVDGEE